MRLDNPGTADFPAIRKEVSEGKTVTVQYSRPLYTPSSLAALNKLCEELDDKLCVRFYGHYDGAFDCANLKYLPSVKSLYLDCLRAVENFDSLKQLECLSQLNIGIFELGETDFLSWNNLSGISSLRLSETRKNHVELRYLERYGALTSLFLGGHIRDVQTIGKLPKITDLSLSIPSKASVEFLNTLPNLKSLRFILGGRANLDELSIFPMEVLEIQRVKGFNGLGNLSKFSKLKKLLIADQIQLKCIDFGTDLSRLEDVDLINCKNLETVAGLSHLRNLRKLWVCKTSIDFEDFIQQELPESLKILAFYTTKKIKDAAIRERLNALGYTDGSTQTVV